MTKAPAKPKLAREFSAGGVVVRDGEVLLVKVENLEGKILWTLPKGHVDPGETSQQAAVREVLEETGYQCEILSSLETVEYFFRRGKNLVKKQVKWFLMRCGEKTGEPDAEEIIETAWVRIDEAKERLEYKGDLELMAQIAVDRKSK